MNELSTDVVNVDPAVQVDLSALHVPRNAVTCGQECSAGYRIWTHLDPFRVENYVFAIHKVHEVTWHVALPCLGGSTSSLSGADSLRKGQR